jgi:cytochrome c-type biogenesis protein CcmH/NrfG
VHLHRRKLDEAQELVAQARELNPKEGEYLAVWAYIQAEKRQREEDVDDLIEQLKLALTWNPKSERAMLYMGQMLKRQNKHQSAHLFFQQVLDVNPRNLEAAREVQLWKVRNKDKKEKEEKSKGLLKRFFK